MAAHTLNFRFPAGLHAQPWQRPVLNRASGLAQGLLCSLFNAAVDARTAPYNYVNGMVGTLGKGSQAGTRRGMMPSFLKANSDYMSIPLDLSSTSVITLTFWQFIATFTVDDQLSMEFGSPSFANNVNGFLIDLNGSGSPAGVVGFGGPGANINTATIGFNSPAGGVWHHYAFIFDRTGTNAATCLPLQLIDMLTPVNLSGANRTGSPTGNFSNSTLFLMCRNASSLFGTGQLANVNIWGRALNRGELMLTYAKPWSLFRNRVTRSSFGASPFRPWFAMPTGWLS